MNLAELSRCFALAAAIGGALLSINQAAAQQATSTDIPNAPREMRGVWISSVYNGNWPSQKGLPVAQQQQELIAMMDRAKAANLNAVIFQVRPGADAMYQSNLEPWSEFLTGTQGQPPQPFYDPLQFAIDEAHKRGLQLHAWFNPYRASTRLTGTFASNHVSRTMPQAVKELDKLMWFDPGNKQAQDHTLQVILDVVRRYDVDGVQFDDYFYPYAEYVKGMGGKFPDDDSYAAYQQGGGKMSQPDWRRENVNTLMRRTYESIKQIKPQVYFGIAPFGIWRPGYPEGIVGMDPYDQLYADSRKWLAEGWLDYFSPQLYWDLSKEKQSYPKLLAWWVQQNAKGRHVWPGISISGVGNGFPTDDILKRIEITRRQPGATGVIYFSMKPLMDNQGDLATQLKQTAYAAPALVPTSPWLERQPPTPVTATVSRDVATGGMALQWSAPTEPDAFLVAIYARVNGAWRFDVAPASAQGYNFGATGALPDAIAISTVDRLGNESPKQNVPLTGGNASQINIPAPVTAPALPYNR
jgi:uncharacterized lipoprotein YddW (UPF0748 family)